MLNDRAVSDLVYSPGAGPADNARESSNNPPAYNGFEPRNNYMMPNLPSMVPELQVLQDETRGAMLGEVAHGRDAAASAPEVRGPISCEKGMSTRYTERDILLFSAEKQGQFNCHVTMKDVTVTGDCDISDKQFSTFFTALKDIAKALVGIKGQTSRRTMLNRVDTAFAPGKLCLVLGPPQSGKSSLLRYISGRLDADLHPDSQGELRFNSHEINRRLLPRIASYVPQTDQHAPTLSVERTLNFSFDCQMKRHLHDTAKKSLNVDLNKIGNPRPVVEHLLNMFMLTRCKDTRVGDELLRGVSGGERKRVTSAEMICGPSMVLCMDEISTGLDSAATASIVSSLGSISHILGKTVIISLLQPPPEVVALFDEILIMGPGGNLVYHGPVTLVEDYFRDKFGFIRPRTVEIGDFLADITTEDAKLYFSQDIGMPPSCIEMAEVWRRSKLRHEYIAPRYFAAKEAGKDPKTDSVVQDPYTSEFGAPWGELFWTVFRRHLDVVIKDDAFVKQKIFQAIFQGIMLGTIFWQTTDDGSKLSLLFLYIATVSMGSMSTIDIISAKRAVFYKQRDCNMYPTVVYTLSEFAADIPLNLMEVLLFGVVIYFFVGFTTNAFGVFIVASFLATCMFQTLFKAIIACSSDASAAQGLGMGIVSLSFCFSGFLVTRASIPDYFIWIYWIMPYSWIIRMLAVNEYSTAGPNGRYDQMIGPVGQQKRLGVVYLEAFAMQPETHWIGYGFVYLCCVLTALFIFYTAGMHYLRLGNVRPIISKKVTRRTLFKGRSAASSRRLPLREDGDVDEDEAEEGRAEAALSVLKNLTIQPPRIDIVLKSLGYSVRVKGAKEDKVLLTNINAVFRPGTMTALMGSSGAGKTTLMDVIAGRKTAGKATGEILINGQLQDLKTFSRVSGYVEQTDIHMPTATVHEALRFSAYHRLPSRMPNEEKERVVEAVIDMIELRPILGKQIGFVGNGLSVEQRKRVTIAVEVTANPSVLFLDEPTSGLDSRAARIVMRAIRRVAASGRTVVCTIHQPSYEIFSMFDNLLLLKTGGFVVYNGSLGPTAISPLTGETYFTAGDLVKYFESLAPRLPHMGSDKNPAEFMLERAGPIRKEDDPEYVDYIGAYSKSHMSKEIEESIRDVRPGAPLHMDSRYALAIYKQLYLSLVRWFQNYWRNVAYSFTRILMVIIIAVLFSLASRGVTISEITTQAQVQSFNGAMFAGVLFTAAIQSVMVVPVLGETKILFYKELAASMYHPIAFVSGLLLAELPWLITVAFLHTLIFYPIIQLYNDPTYYLHYYLAMLLFATVFCFFGQMMSALLPTTRAASLAVSAMMGTMNLFAGFFMPERAIPWPWKLFYYISPARYGLKSTMPRQFFCTMTCFMTLQGSSTPMDCNSVAMQNVTSLALAPYQAGGPGCSVMEDWSGAVARSMGEDWTKANLGVTAPYKLTVWDYFTITTGSYDNEVWPFTWVMIGFAVAFELITILSMTFMKHLNR